MSPSNLLDALEEAAQICGGVALSHFRKGLSVEIKADGSEVTRADRDAEEAVRRWIERYFPADAILGEELGWQERASGRRWIIDPIDGTRSFVRGVPLWGSLIALEEGGTVIGGAINCAATGDLLVAVAGEGCWHNGTRASVSTTNSIAASTILTTDSRFVSDRSRKERWSRLSNNVAAVRGWGDCYGYVLVATGRAELMVDDRMNPWDVAALIPVVEEAGGVITDWTGHRGIGPDTIATNAALATELRRQLDVPWSTA